jgi:hypothetical protein
VFLNAQPLWWVATQNTPQFVGHEAKRFVNPWARAHSVPSWQRLSELTWKGQSQHTRYPPNTHTILPTHTLSSQHTRYRHNTHAILTTHTLSSQHTLYPPNTHAIVTTHVLSSQHTRYPHNTHAILTTHTLSSQHTRCPHKSLGGLLGVCDTHVMCLC